MGHFPRHVLAVVYQSSQTDDRRDSLSRLSQTDGTCRLAIFTVPSFPSCFSSRLPVPSVCDRRDSLSRLPQTDGTGRLAIFTVRSCFRETRQTKSKTTMSASTWADLSITLFVRLYKCLVMYTILKHTPKIFHTQECKKLTNNIKLSTKM